MKISKVNMLFILILISYFNNALGNYFNKKWFQFLFERKNYAKCKNFTPYIASGSVFFTLLAFQKYNNSKPSNNKLEDGKNISPIFKEEILPWSIENFYKKK